MTTMQEEAIRPIASFPPSVWGDQFLVYDEVSSLIYVYKQNSFIYRTCICVNYVPECVNHLHVYFLHIYNYI